MLLTREEMTFDFGGKTFDPARDKELLAWMVSQFLFGEVTGIQCGHWLYTAPDLEAAKFIARQGLEEMQHVDNFLRILKMLEVEPKPAHPALRFLATGMMGQSWAEHVALEMAQGEGFVLLAFYAMIDTLNHQPSLDILRRAVKQEERHVAFGEAQTAKAIVDRPWLRRRLLGLSLVSMWGVKRLGSYIEARLPSEHPVMRQFPAFLKFANQCAELRLTRLGLLTKPLAAYSTFARGALIAEAYMGKAVLGLGGWLKGLVPIWGKPKRLTDTYLADPRVRGFGTIEPEPAE